MKYAPSISAQEFARLRQSPDASEQNRATHASASDEVWRDVIVNYPDLKTWVAHNKTVPLTILQLLVQDSDWRVRCAVAGKRKLDRALFLLLSTDDHEAVRAKVFLNAKCPPDV